MHKCETLGQRIWDEVRCYWELVLGEGGGGENHWEHIENFDENTLRT